MKTELIDITNGWPAKVHHRATEHLPDNGSRKQEKTVLSAVWSTPRAQPRPRMSTRGTSLTKAVIMTRSSHRQEQPGDLNPVLEYSCPWPEGNALLRDLEGRYYLAHAERSKGVARYRRLRHISLRDALVWYVMIDKYNHGRATGSIAQVVRDYLT